MACSLEQVCVMPGFFKTQLETVYVGLEIEFIIFQIQHSYKCY